MLEQIINKPVLCSAAPGWRCTNSVLLEKEKLNFSYNSDCRGQSIFYPMVNGVQLKQPQIPVTLPTYDEVIGSNGISNANYNEYLLSQIKSDRLNVLTIHAEAEGISCLGLFQDFMIKTRSRAICLLPLKELLSDCEPPQTFEMVWHNIPEREGWISFQKGREGQLHDE